MPDTGLKIVGTGPCLLWCRISSSFENSLKMSGHRGYEFLEFWCWNLVPFLPDIGFQLLKSLWSSLLVVEKFIFRLMMHQMFSIGEISGLQAGQFSTWTLLLRSHAVVIAAVCGFALSCWNRHRLEGSICCSKTFIYLSAFIVPSKTCKLAITICTYEPWPAGHDGASGPCSHMASFLHDRALVGICKWNCGLCLPTAVSGSIPGPI